MIDFKEFKEKQCSSDIKVERMTELGEYLNTSYAEVCFLFRKITDYCGESESTFIFGNLDREYEKCLLLKSDEYTDGYGGSASDIPGFTKEGKINVEACSNEGGVKNV